MLKIIFAVSLFLTFSSAESKNGKCPNLNLQKNFDKVRYAGLWYLHSRVIGSQFETGDCTSAEYTVQENGFYQVLNTERVNGEFSSIIGQAYCEDLKRLSGQCYVRFSDYAPWSDYEVVETDYDNYSIVYSCKSTNDLKIDRFWVLKRNRDLDATQYVDFALKKFGFTSEEIIIINQSGC